jgi:LuxR family transcriptional regulator, maltose regulon positive regulatory protein
MSTGGREIGQQQPLDAGSAALQRGDWQGAIAAFGQVPALGESPEALEGLGTAYWWLDDQQNVIEKRERAFRLYRERGDRLSAGRLATIIALDYADYRGDLAVANGWISRSERLLLDFPESVEAAWQRLYQGFLELMFNNNAAEARRYLQGASELAGALSNIDIEMMCVALEGLILVREGRVADGMRHMDEAMTAAMGGEMSDLAAIGTTCCSLIYACEAVADYDRANQWCERAREFCRRFGMDGFFAICRNYYATVLIWKGEWEQAEDELVAAMKVFEASRPSYIKESLAKLGELRRRQGRLDEAQQHFLRAEPHRLALLGRASLALDRSQPDEAIDLLHHVLRRVGAEDVAERVFALERLVRAHVLRGDRAEAGTYLGELQSAAASVGTQPLLASAKAATAALAYARGELSEALSCFEDAIDLFEVSDAEFEAGRLRLDLTRLLCDLQRDARALEQAVMAQATFKRLGSAHYADEAGRLVSKISRPIGQPPSGTSLPHGLTPREAEVLWLIAAGKTNQEISADLVLSIRTVERHISTIYEKLQLHGRAARASAAAIAMSLRSNT